MKTKELIERLFEYDECVGPCQLPTRMFNEIIKRLEELEELKECSVLGVGGKWIRVRDIQLLTNIVKE